MTIRLDFEPCPLLKGTHKQTIMGTVINFEINIPSITEFIALPDGDEIAIEITTPKKWKEKGTVAILLHGLCGSHESSCVVRLSKILLKQNIRVLRMNLRGCGSGFGHARELYHGGQSDDLKAVVDHAIKYHPDSPLVLVGFSLGGNILLKYLGEMGSKIKDIVKIGVAVSPPVDLIDSTRSLQKYKIYEQYFIRLLLKTVKNRHMKYPELDTIKLPYFLRFFDFDELYLAPQCGFSSALDYYRRCSARWLVPSIEIPCKVLFSKDDPIINHKMLDTLPHNNNIELFKTQHGGHLGYLANPKSGCFYWMHETIKGWILEAIQKN